MDPSKDKRIFPVVLLERDSLDFSFSGIKSAVKRRIDEEIRDQGTLSEDFIGYISYEFEEIATDILSEKIMRAYHATGAEMILLAGGVSANSKLKEKIKQEADSLGIPFLAPVKNIYSMDNAAMVGIRVFYKIRYS